MNLFASFEQQLAERKKAGLYRQRRSLQSAQGAAVQLEGHSLINFCSNDYLGLANHPRLIAACQAGAARWGVGSGAAHLVCGHFEVQQQFENRFAAWVGKPAALLFSSGFMANQGVITALVGRKDAIFADRLNHASLNDAALLARADFHRYPHNDLLALERLLQASHAARKLIVSDSVFSMDGDLAPLQGLLQLAERYDALLYLDDAHGFGVLGEGRGALAHCGLDSSRIIYMATLGKAAGVSGAVVAADEIVIDWLINNAHSYIYTTAAPPLLAQALLESLMLIQEDAWRRERLIQHQQLFRTLLQPVSHLLGESATPIQPVLLQDNAQALSLSQTLREAGFWVGAIRPPTVPTPRLRVTLSAAHSTEEVRALAQCMLALLEEES